MGLELVEPLLHFVVPLVTPRSVGLPWKKALFASFLALTFGSGFSFAGLSERCSA